MILGIFDRDRPGGALKEQLFQAAGHAAMTPDEERPAVWAQGAVAMCWAPRHIETLDEGPQPFVNAEGTLALVFNGKIYNLDELKARLGSDREVRAERSGEVLLHLYERYGADLLETVNGKFAFALWDGRSQTVLLGRDRLGIEPLFYAGDGARLVFGSSLQGLLASGLIDRRLNHNAILQYLLYCYNPGPETFVRNAYKLLPGRTLSVNGASLSTHRYWRLSFGEVRQTSEAQYRDEIMALIEDAIRIRLDATRPPGVFLSGGTDSSAIVALTSRLWPGTLNTFSFRCAGRSYDESSYARMVAERFGANHTEIPYEPPEPSLLKRAVAAMDEPFCDVGIELATFLLGQAAQGKVSYVFSGEGGDELFAGHPVYTADKVAAIVDHIPRAITSPVAKVLQRIPDSDQKRNLQVKLKRFAYSFTFPPELLSHHWRIYYTRQELLKVCRPEFIAACDVDGMYEPVISVNREADGGDLLSRSLYSDHFTLIDFYLRRLGLLRTFSIENRMPLMDYRLVEYAAKIPPELKLRGLSDTKHIYRKALTGAVPREILYDRPKLGHSVPMKNWLRDDAGVGGWLDEVLFNGTLQDSGLFNLNFVKTLVTEHRRKSQNHSHRLWGLGVLALWLADWNDASAAAARARVHAD